MTVKDVLFFFGVCCAAVSLFPFGGCDSENPGPRGEQKVVQTEDQRAKERFLTDIDQHYQEALSLYEEGDLEAASKEADLFREYQSLHYKDVGELSRKIMTALYTEKLKGLPMESYETNLSLYKELSGLEPGNARYAEKVEYYSTKLHEEEEELADAETAVMEWKCYKTRYGDFVKAEGTVKNVSKADLKRVLATVTLRDKGGKKVLSEGAVIEARLLPPGQSSNFKVIADYLPAMSKAEIEFKPILGEKLVTYTRRKFVPVVKDQVE